VCRRSCHGLRLFSIAARFSRGNDGLERAVSDEVKLLKLLALTLPERAVMLAALEDPPDTLTELRPALLSDHRWRVAEGLG
jgi:hypothetical protein